MITLTRCKSDKVMSLLDSDSDKIKQYFIHNVDWDLVFSVITSLRRKYNTGAETFVKSDIISETIQQASNGKIKYIDEIGCDFYIPELDLRVEMKSTNNKIFPSVGGRFTSILKLKNFRSVKEVNISSMQKTFDYLLMVEPLKCGIVKYEKMVPYFQIYSDGIGAKIDVSDIEFIREVYSVKTTDILLFDRYEQMKKQIIQDVRDNLYYEQSI